MSIQVGDKLPKATFKQFGADGMKEIDFAAHIAGKHVIVFAVPGAFTPSCHEQHLPGYVQKADDLKAEGVDDIICVSVNDPFVMKAWGEASGASGKVTMLGDWDGSFTKAIGLEFDGSGAGLGMRSKRYAMVVKDGVVESLNVEEAPPNVDVSGAEACLVQLKSAA